MCIRILGDLEPLWSGALRCKEIIQELHRKMSSVFSSSTQLAPDSSQSINQDQHFYSNDGFVLEDSRIVSTWFDGQMDFASNDELLRDLFR